MKISNDLDIGLFMMKGHYRNWWLYYIYLLAIYISICHVAAPPSISIDGVKGPGVAYICQAAGPPPVSIDGVKGSGAAILLHAAGPPPMSIDGVKGPGAAILLLRRWATIDVFRWRKGSWCRDHALSCWATIDFRWWRKGSWCFEAGLWPNISHSHDLHSRVRVLRLENKSRMWDICHYDLP
jgi:hypothetical protein